jgi:mannose-6-phosphate isomerase-like protein (cupin superfamily)
MVRVLSIDELRRGGRTARFEGHAHDAKVSFFVVNGVEGDGPDLHRHPYEETFVILDGSATFTVDGETLEAAAGTILVVPPGAPHKFVVGRHGLRSVNIHSRDRMSQEDLPDDGS